MSYFALFPTYHGVLVKLSFLTGVPLFNSLLRAELWTAKFGLKNPETSHYCVVHNIFQYTENVYAWISHVTDRRTDRIMIAIVCIELSILKKTNTLI